MYPSKGGATGIRPTTFPEEKPDSKVLRIFFSSAPRRFSACVFRADHDVPASDIGGTAIHDGGVR